MAGAVGAVAAGVLIIGAWRGVQTLAIGVAYKAKVVCSGTFVSQRDLSAVLADLHVDDLAILKHIGVSVDPDNLSVAASAFGLVTRRAVYREGLGCALVLDGLTPPTLVANDGEGVGGRVPALPVTELPGPTLLTDENGGELEAAVARAFSEPDPARPQRTMAATRGKPTALTSGSRFRMSIEGRTSACPQMRFTPLVTRGSS